MKTITLTEQQLRDFATVCFNLGVNGHRDLRTDEDLFEKLVETTIGKTFAFHVGDQVKLVKTDKDAPASIDDGQTGVVKELSSETNVILVKLGDRSWWFEPNGVMSGFSGCHIEKVTDH